MLNEFVTLSTIVKSQTERFNDKLCNFFAESTSFNMFSLTRRRREAERNKKLEEIFRDADENGNGKITQEQMIKIFEANEIAGKHNLYLSKKRNPKIA